MQKTTTAYFSFFFRQSILLWILFNTASCASFLLKNRLGKGLTFMIPSGGNRLSIRKMISGVPSEP
jgi:hypothetical protein